MSRSANTPATSIPVDQVPHILFVEDNPQDVELLELAFAPYQKRIDYRYVPNTISALDFLAKRGRYSSAPTPDLILLDLSLPILSGHLLLQEIAQDGNWKKIPVIVLSSSNRSEDIDRAYHQGAMLYVVKPSHWDRWSDLAASFAALVGLSPDAFKPSSERISSQKP
jgi:chemotaxis family two-component system response regulator Rcp1